MHPAPGGDDRGRGAAQGIGLVAGLVARTLGPAGRASAVRDQAGGDIEAVDADAIVACFTPDDPRAAVGAGYVRDLVRAQRAAVPDGAATAVVLAGAMVGRAVAAVDGNADPMAWRGVSRPPGTGCSTSSAGAPPTCGRRRRSPR